MSLVSTSKKLYLDLKSLGPVSRGFLLSEYKHWLRNCYRHRHRDYGFTKQETKWAIDHGFMPEQVKNLGITPENVDKYISAYDYAYLNPLNGLYAKWIGDKVTVFNIFKPFRNVMPEMYYHIMKVWKDPFIIPMAPGLEKDTIPDILDLMKEKKKVALKLDRGDNVSSIEWADDKWLFDGKEVEQEWLEAKLLSYSNAIVITEWVEPTEVTDYGVLNLIVFNEYGDNPIIGDAYFNFEGFGKRGMDDLNDYGKLQKHNLDEKLESFKSEVVNEKTGEWRGEKLPYWDEIVETFDKLSRFVPQLEFYCAKIVISKDGFKIIDFENNPNYPICKPFSEETSAYLKRKVAQKRAVYEDDAVRKEMRHKKKLAGFRKIYSTLFFTPGFDHFITHVYMRESWKDFKTNKETTLKQKIWGLKRGFVSYRIPQYGITEENYEEHLSDYEYWWMRHMNPRYKTWLEDKITVKYICSDFNECFPEYYFHIVCKNGNNKVIPMMDLPEGYTNNYDEIFRLVEEKGVLALKRDKGSHGDGFYKFTWDGEKYQLNYKDATKEEIMEILTNIQTQYLVTEYIDMCDELKAVYDGAVNTVRMIVFKRDGKTPETHNAYIRFGSKKTGAVDNVNAGGMTAHIDVDTGHFHDAKIVKDNELVDCPTHPDTGVPIDGYLPHWDEVKEQVMNVTACMKQLHWFGADIAVTNTGIKFPEINRCPAFPAVECYAPETQEFLLYKLSRKKAAYGFDQKKDKKLFSLHKRKTDNY